MRLVLGEYSYDIQKGTDGRPTILSHTPHDRVTLLINSVFVAMYLEVPGITACAFTQHVIENNVLVLIESRFLHPDSSTINEHCTYSAYFFRLLCKLTSTDCCSNMRVVWKCVELCVVGTSGHHVSTPACVTDSFLPCMLQVIPRNTQSIRTAKTRQATPLYACCTSDLLCVLSSREFVQCARVCVSCNPW